MKLTNRYGWSSLRSSLINCIPLNLSTPLFNVTPLAGGSRLFLLSFWASIAFESLDGEVIYGFSSLLKLSTLF